MKKPEANGLPYFPAEYSAADARAFQQLQSGEASPEQQKRVLAWLINVLCCTYDLSYRPDSDRDTAFAEGKRHVGLQIIKLLKLDTAKLAEIERAAAAPPRQRSGRPRPSP